MPNVLRGALCLLALWEAQTCARPRAAPSPVRARPLISPRLQLTPQGVYRADTCWRVSGPTPVPCWAFPLDPERDACHLPPRLFTERDT